MSTLRKEILLLVLLAFFSSLMEADQSLYKIVGIPNEMAQSVIRLIAFIIVLLITIYALYVLATNDRNTLSDLLESLFFSLFRQAKFTQPNKAFRVNLYKKFESGTREWRWQYFKRLVRYWTSCVRYWFSRLRGNDNTELIEDRRLELGQHYLLCIGRYGYKDGKPINEATTYPIKITGGEGRLFVGRTFQSKDEIETALNNYNINEIVVKIGAPADQAEIDFYKGLLNDSPIKNYKRLWRFKRLSRRLSVDERKNLRNFMAKTNTLAYDLFAINNGIHSNHFAGFKIRKNTKIWGVIQIDALEPNGNNFYDFIGVQQLNDADNLIWLKRLFDSYSKLLSDAIEK